MSITKRYSSPSCNLILEGMEDVNSESADILSGHAPMSILINAECHLLKSERKLSGGSVFLNNLSHAVSSYAQGFLSGLFVTSKTDTREYPQVSLDKVADCHLHRLTLEPQPDSGESKTEIDLTTVELFDLVDAIDKLYADRSVLPNMNLELQSVSKRHRKPEQPLAERVTPVIAGLSSLAIAAGAFFMIPIPEVAPPESTPANETSEIEAEEKPEQIPANSTPETSEDN